MKFRVFVGVALISALVGMPLQTTHAQSKDAKSLQQQLAKKKKELNAVAADRRKIDTQRGGAVKELRAVEEKVGQTAKALVETQQKIAVETNNLGKLNTQQQQLRLTLGDKEAERAELLKAAYRRNRSGPLKAFLSQDTLAASNRNLRYHRYLQQDRSGRINVLNTQLKELDAVQSQIKVRTTNLTAYQKAQQQQALQLQKDREARNQIVGKLNKQFADAQSREKALGKDVAGLNKLLAQLRAAAAKAERERKAAAAQRAKQEAAARAQAAREARAEQQRIARANAANAKAARETAAKQANTRSGVRTTQAARTAPAAQAIATEEPASTQPIRKPQVVATKPVVATATGPSVGGMGWPANGSLLAGFGGTMPDGRKSSGLLIAAPAGSPVRAVASGEVVYAQWMTGYGQLLIIDHGGGRMSLYAYNEALLKRAGDRVNRGDAIGTVGNSGGHGRPAVYFELRSNGAPINPRSMLN